MPATEQVPATLQGYLAYLHNERNYSPLTAENYARDIHRLLALAGATPLPDLRVTTFAATSHSCTAAAWAGVRWREFSRRGAAFIVT